MGAARARNAVSVAPNRENQSVQISKVLGAALLASLTIGAQAQDPAGTRWPVPGVEVPTTELVIEAYVTIDPAVEVGPTDDGTRRFIPITGGRFIGKGIKGEVVRGGADWQLVRPDGVVEVHALYSLHTDDGAAIVVDNQGIIVPGKPAANGEPATAPYVRTSPRFHAPKGKYDWLNRGVFVGTIGGGAGGGAVVIRVFRVL